MTPSLMSCEEAIAQLADYLDRELDAAASARLDRHLELCRSCFSRAEFERELKLRIAALRDPEVHPDLENRIRTLVRSFATRAGADGDPGCPLPDEDEGED